MPSTDPLIFVHLGDLHITKASEPNYLDYLSIVAQLALECGPALDFVVLPGDNADNGKPYQYKLVSTALKMLDVPVHLIPGDHDMESGNLDAFYTMPLAEPLPKSRVVKGVCCLFLDISGTGSGGPDFRLGLRQYDWLRQELAQATAQSEPIVVFMHTYPADFTDEQETTVVNQLFADHNVVLVDIGHTHYNELANDGHTIFAATRSTGQIEEGPVGYSVATVQGETVSWRFKTLHDAFPFVLITTPTDYRLLRTDHQSYSTGVIRVEAVVLGSRSVDRVACRINQYDWQIMTPTESGRGWQAEVEVPAGEVAMLTVEAVDSSGRPGQHIIQLSPADQNTPVRHKNGSDADSIGAWPQNGIVGTQLGPNRNGKPS
ncbi:metallophosphoesterase family protein [Spirosoma rhododendri]|uniref:Metallophosphoesterase n=1 Tax=Spirosoma rhododendri TaxID=2728024 RepID=A0A7L5DIA2_9BACT|nr:metallophosphoesterase [Spirosoma rhododendri]QJD78079.1 metallophosphoesterase [Spirosoma rhododendri]